MRTAACQLAAGGFQVGTNKPLELLQFGNLTDQHVLGDQIELVEEAGGREERGTRADRGHESCIRRPAAEPGEELSIDGKLAWPSSGEVIDVATRQTIATLEDEVGRHVGSEKLLEIDFTSGKVTAAGNQFGVGRVK